MKPVDRISRSGGSSDHEIDSGKPEIDNGTKSGHCCAHKLRINAGSKAISDFIPIDILFEMHGNILWENGRHKANVHAFLMEIHEIMVANGLHDYDDALLDTLVKQFRAKDNSNATINRKLSALYKLLRKAERMGQISRLPTYLRLKERNGRVRFLSPEEEAALFAEIGRVEPDFERLCIFLVDSGARVGEALGLKWTDVQGSNATFWITKSGRSRTVPLTRRARRAVAGPSRQAHAGPFSMIGYQNFRYHWNRARKAVGLAGDPQVVPHILRHTCASRLVQAGIDLRRVQSFLGHQTIQMTLRYAHLATDDLAQCAAALDLRNEGGTEPPVAAGPGSAGGAWREDAGPISIDHRQRKVG